MFIPVALGIISSLCDSETVNLDDLQQRDDESLTLNTRFNDARLLLKTLSEYGLCVEQISDQCFSVEFADGTILYERKAADEPFTMTIRDIRDKEQLFSDLKEIEQEYGGNVQEYTYQRVLSNVPQGMSIESEEVLDDDSILITLNV